jgi:hypothetical protein
MTDDKQHFTEVAIEKAKRKRNGISTWMYHEDASKEYFVEGHKDGTARYYEVKKGK